MKEKTSLLWEKVMSLKENGQHETFDKVANTLNVNDVHTILATMEFFGASSTWLQQTYFDLTSPKYRVFDWLAMALNGRNDDDRPGNEMALKVLVHAFIKVNGVPSKFVEDLRYTDYQIDESWTSIEID